MSSNLEYPPLFIFVLTLTYKKKKEKEKQLKKPQQQKECFDVGEGWSISPSVTRWYGDWARERLPHAGPHPGVPRGTQAVVIWTSRHTTLGIISFDDVMGTSHRTVVGPFQILRYYVTRCKLSGPEGHMERPVYFM